MDLTPIEKAMARESGSSHARLETKQEEMERVVAELAERVLELADALTNLQAQLGNHMVRAGHDSVARLPESPRG